MSAAKATKGTIIFRTWNDSRKLIEIEEAFSSLDELFAACLPQDETKLVDRIIIQGLDDRGNLRQLTLVFESVTIS
ncbi:MAG: hypothetical protein H5T62_11075 [Anaerolineae bacterium]|nr:hypothetical protein [Anaerolineae bacterium]